jgi:hypothetical protein
VRFRRWGIPVASVVAAVLGIAMLVGCDSGGAGAEDRPSRSAQLLVEDASLAGIHSGEAEVTLKIANLANGEVVRMRSRALFIGVGYEDPPQFDMTIQSHGDLAGRKAGFFGAFLLLAHRAVLFYRGQTFRPRQATFDLLKSKVQAAQRRGNAGNAMACVEAVKGEKISQLLQDFRIEGHRRDHDGTPVTLIGSELDVGRAFDTLVQMARDPACGAQLKAAGLPVDAQLEAFASAAAQDVEKATVRLAVDKQQVMRDLSVEVMAEGPGREPLEVDFTWLLEDANQLKELPQPVAEAQLPLLLKQFGTDLPTAQGATGGQLFLALLRAVGEEMTGR